jgi:hypothetical protein
MSCNGRLLILSRPHPLTLSLWKGMSPQSAGPGRGRGVMLNRNSGEKDGLHGNILENLPPREGGGQGRGGINGSVTVVTKNVELGEGVRVLKR